MATHKAGLSLSSLMRAFWPFGAVNYGSKADLNTQAEARRRGRARFELEKTVLFPRRCRLEAGRLREHNACNRPRVITARVACIAVTRAVTWSDSNVVQADSWQVPEPLANDATVTRCALTAVVPHDWHRRMTGMS